MSVTTHSIEFEANSVSNVIHLKVTGKLTKEDYDIFVPELEKWVATHGTIRILFEMEDFHGWTLSAGWEDTKLAFKHYSDIERMAFVGDSAWEQGMAIFCKPFTGAKIQYFDRSDRAAAIEWIAE